MTRKTLQNTASEADCCTKCGIWDSATTHVSYHANSGQCDCTDIADGSSQNSNSNKFYGGSCSAPSGRKKRDSNLLSFTQNNTKTDQAEMVKPREKRNAMNLAKSREMFCTLTGNAGYWKYDYTVPDRCYLVNCSLSDLQNIAINNDQVELDQPITTLYYNSAYK